MTNLYMVVWTDSAVAQNVTLDASRMRCGQGTSVQLWTPPDAALEVAKCKRYLPSWAGAATIPFAPGQCTSVATALIYFPFDVEARAIATGQSSLGSFYLLTAAGGTQAVTGFSFTQAGTRMAICTATTAAGLVAGNATSLNSNSANGLIYFTGCEL